MDKYIVSIFSDETSAYKGETALKELHSLNNITLYGTAVLKRNSGGEFEVLQSVDNSTGRGMAVGVLSGGIIGLLGGPTGSLAGMGAGGLLGSMVDLQEIGVDAKFIQEVGDELSPGSFCVIAEADERWTVPVNTEIQKLGGIIFRRRRSEVAEEQFDREVQEVEDEMSELKAAFAEKSDDIKKSLSARAESVKKKAALMKENSEQKMDKIKDEFDHKVESIQTQIKQAKDDQKEKLESSLNDTKALFAEKKKKLNSVINKIDNAIRG